MSPVDRAGSVSEISPCHSFLYKNGPVTEISVFATEISITELEFFPYENSSPDTGTVLDETFSTAHGL